MKVRDDVAERFPRDVAGHEMRVIRSDGIDRHLRFQQPGTYCMGFDLITWPGHLCFTGDMGTFVFARLADMFEFFRTDRGINPPYWAEKVLAADRDGVTEYVADLFREAVQQRLDDAEASPEVRKAVADEVLSEADDGEHSALHAAYHFERDGFRFEDVSELHCRDYTYRFMWCCHALVWAIAKFDAQAEPQPVAA
jgi:hypothetical protein